MKVDLAKTSLLLKVTQRHKACCLSKIVRLPEQTKTSLAKSSKKSLAHFHSFATAKKYSSRAESSEDIYENFRSFRSKKVTSTPEKETFKVRLSL